MRLDRGYRGYLIAAAIDSGAAFDPLRRRHDLAVSAVLPYPELVDQQAVPVRAELVVADPLREKVHVLRRNERHPWSGVGDLAVDPLPERAGSDRIARLLRLRLAHLTVDARVAELACIVVAAEEADQEIRRGRVASPVMPVEADLRPVPRVLDLTPVCVAANRFQSHAVAERVQDLHGHPVEALRL